MIDSVFLLVVQNEAKNGYFNSFNSKYLKRFLNNFELKRIAHRN